MTYTASQEPDHLTNPSSIPAFVSFAPSSSLFTTATSNPKAKSKTLMPSAEALAKAAQRLAQWDKEFEDEVPGNGVSAEEEEVVKASTSKGFGGFESASTAGFSSASAAGFSSASAAGFSSASASGLGLGISGGGGGGSRPVLGTLENSFQPPSTPTPAGKGFAPLVSRIAPTLNNAKEKKEFKSPLLTTLNTPAPARASSHVPAFSSPLKPTAHKGGTKAFVAPTRLGVAGPSTPIRPPPLPSASTVTPIRPPAFTSPAKKSLGVTPRRTETTGGLGKKPGSGFSTPFKAGMRPGESGRMALDTPSTRTVASPAVHVTGSGRVGTVATSKGKGKGRATYFDLCKRFDLRRWMGGFLTTVWFGLFIVAPKEERVPLATCGLRPQRYEERELEEMGMYVVLHLSFFCSLTLFPATSKNSAK